MNLRLPFDKDGCKIAGVIAIIAICLGNIGTNMGWLGFLMTLGCLAFFRDPERVHPSRDSVAVSPADGIILKIIECTAPDELKLPGTWQKISVFMSIFNVHVNRSPVAGTVEKMFYVEGKFFNVTLDKASDYNERRAVYMRLSDGTKIVFVQIAGLIARRIRCDIAEGQELEIGQRVGMIRFGSRVDIYLPNDAKILVEEGQIVVAGETILADLKKRKEVENGKEQPREKEL
ncbi:MAG: phosphatidylserine decarboxylase [Holosporaceae bacterium]|jgi:phosphatidylserine decarboxylase|nr:phosphatidylserine decarboxylase [Holosporaceae bacterium]